ncbi:MAG: hypothetical protein ACI8WT_001980 [Clostridium sp.]|jgi:hypothetical protein
MKAKNKNVSEKSGKSSISIVMYAVASVVAIIGIALLVNNILLFKSTVNQYVAQGYTAATVTTELLKSQLLPGIFEPVAVYGGIAFVLLGVGIVNKKVSKCLMLLTKVEDCNNTIEESLVEQNDAYVENVETTETIEGTEEIETVKEVKKAD